MDASVDITILPTGLLGGSIKYDSLFNNLSMFIGANSVIGRIATDDDTFGCPISQCNFTGSFSVPEPDPVTMLIVAFGLFGLLGMRGRRCPENRELTRFGVLRDLDQLG